MDSKEGSVKVLVGASLELSNGRWKKVDVTLDDTDLLFMVRGDEARLGEVAIGLRFTALHDEGTRLVSAAIYAADPTDHRLDELHKATETAKASLNKLRGQSG
jgi:hypothetical protein